MNHRTRQFLAVGAGVAVLAAANRFGRRDTFRGKSVVITGGSRGLGLEMARLWAAEGAHVSICARTADDLRRAEHDLRSRGASVFSQSVDVTNQAQVTQFIEDVLHRCGGI